MITDSHITQYKEDGYFVVPGLMRRDEIWELKDEYINAIAKKRTLLPDLRFPTFLPDMCNFCYHPKLQEIARRLIGDTCRVMGEKFVIKWPTLDDSRPYIHFWHQDSGYIGTRHEPYLTCLIALDKSTVENAALSVIPFSKFKPLGVLNHESKGRIDEFQNSDSLAVTYGGETYPGEHHPPQFVIDLDPGDVLVFSSMNLHGSGVNSTTEVRRSYLVHYSDGIIKNSKGELFWRADNLE